MKNIVFFIVVLSSLFSIAQTSNKGLAKKIDSLLISRYNKGLFNGSILVQKDGEIIYKRALGWANVEKRDTLNISNPMRIASVTKTFTAVCVLKLVQEGKVDLHEDINSYLPEIEKKGMTVHHLLSHTSGIAYINGRGHNVSQYGKKRGDNRTTNDDVLLYFKENKPKLKNKVGDKYSYSNISYTILASLIERIEGVKYSEYLEENIFTPLNMNNSSLYLPNDKNTNPEKVLSYYASQDGYKYQRVYYGYNDEGNLIYSSDKYGDKYILSTIEDLNKFNGALVSGKILNNETLNKMIKPALLNNGKEIEDKYGYGIYQYNKTNDLYYAHGGGIAGFSIMNMFDLKGNQFIMLMNINTREYSRLIKDVLKIIEGTPTNIEGNKRKVSKKEMKYYSVFEDKYKINYSNLYD